MKLMNDNQVDQNAKYFEYLNFLRESGKINMFAAPPVLAKAFGLQAAEARKIWIKWTETFEEEN